MKLSIIIPIYNVEYYLTECLESAVSQEGFDYEILCIDDGSTDSSFEILTYIQEKNPDKIRIIRQKNMGLGATRNKGVRMAKGEFILFVDSDDYLIKHSLQKVMKKVAAFSPDILEGVVNVIKNHRFHKFHRKRNVLTEIPESGKCFLANNREFTAVVWGKVYKKSFLQKKLIQNKENTYYEDVLFSIPAYLHAKKVMNTDIAFYNYRLHESSITQRKPTEKHLQDFIHARFEVYLKYLKEIDNVRAKRKIKKKFQKSLWSFLKTVKKSEINSGLKLKYLLSSSKYFVQGFLIY